MRFELAERTDSSATTVDAQRHGFAFRSRLPREQHGAVDAARASIAAAERIGAALQVACSRSLLGQALAAAGDRPAAVEELREAERRGPATPEDSGVASLTARETEISDLITERLTNREIAGRLFLSEKTVESHVRDVFHKLGVSSRRGRVASSSATAASGPRRRSGRDRRRDRGRAGIRGHLARRRPVRRRARREWEAGLAR